ncbi:filamentous hemagglutinin N-terminal domain-containing protein [Pelomonas sp. Root1444]|uniref:two-partner secretion domain-containing protein n=1 Tax=Pelomonas sp. Root1444 TaxID=1736464 RepID=UPI000702D701|nr:filamentous hemagglutinin N-terminal domain-containing protein [Pelomonas sp. Root1444]KQY85962.1 hypothetical protein ASD35_20215 [Pelomonas sp. Root1444]
MKLNRQAGRFTHHCIARAVAVALIPAGLLLAPQAHAAPQGGQVKAGQASIAHSGALTTVQQGSARAVIDWRSFNVGATETVRFDQPNSSAWVLNRVVGNDASSILGRITANGQVMLINPNGIVFGRGAQVDVAGLVASTANLSNADFMAGKLRFTEPGKPGAKVENLGRITVADGGLAALVGHQVANSGFINARLGKVVLAAGDLFTLDLYGDRLVNLVVDPHAMAQLVDSSGVPLAARVDQQGSIVAEGGVVQISAATAHRLVDNAINIGGTIRATSFESAGGVISLRGDGATRLTLTGALDASGLQGGRVEVTAGTVQLAETGRIDASGRSGGGNVAMGGGWQGSGELPHARSVTVTSGAVIDAGATASGHGGTVALWSDGDMRFDGRVNARGGAHGGDGGQVEVSGRERLAFSGDVNAGATNGRAGNLLLDPTNLIVAGTRGNESLPAATASGDFTVKAAAVNRQLVNGTSVTLQASNDITVAADAVIDGRVANGGTAGGGLRLQAGRDIGIDGLVILNNGAFTATAGRSVTQSEASAIATGTGAVAITAANSLALSNVLTTGTVKLQSDGGTLQVSKALGSTGALLTSLEAKAQGNLTLNGALVAGTTTLTSGGTLDTTAATLSSGGAVSMTGTTALRSGAIVTPAAIAASSNGAVTLGAVASASGTVNNSTTKAQGLTVRAGGDVTLGGAAVSSLRVEGAGTGQRAGAVNFGDAGVFSSGDVIANAASITLAKGGISSGGVLTLDASGALASGEGKLESAGAATLKAGSSTTLGSGGLDVTGAQSGAALDAAGALTVNGSIKSEAAVALSSSGSAIALNQNVKAGSFTASAASGFTQAATSAVAAGAGGISITSAGGDLSASNLITLGAVTLNADQGRLSVSGALAGGSATQRVASLLANAKGDLKLNGALVAGTTSVTSGATLDTSTATLDSNGAVTLTGSTAVRSGAIVTPASVNVNSSGAVILGTVAAAAGAVSSSTAHAQSLTVKTPGNVTLGGAAVSGLRVEGADGGDAANVDFGSASVFAGTDGVAVKATGDITLGDNAGISSLGDFSLSSAGAISSKSQQLAAAGKGSLMAGKTLTIGAGGASASGDLTLKSVGDLLALGPIKTRGGTIEAQSTAGSVTLDEVFTWERGVSASGALQVRATQDVTLSKDIGGPDTGYLLLAQGYQPDLRPQVGAASITAGRDVELNGLNLDGSSTGKGLEVTAGRFLVSNAPIGVNKGDIILLSTSKGGATAREGIYLGNSVYSRGLDLGSGGKTAYSITVGGTGTEGNRGGLYLFDNTNDLASVPSQGEIAKIVLANNVANYKRASSQNPQLLIEDPTLVPASNPDAKVTVGADRLEGISFVGTAPAPLRIATLAQQLESGSLLTTYLGGASARTAAGNPTSGISLKVQVYTDANDTSTEALEATGQYLQDNGCKFGQTYLQCGFDYVQIDGYDKNDPNPRSDPPGEPQYKSYDQYDRPELGSNAVVGYLLTGRNQGVAKGFVNLLDQAGYARSTIATFSKQDYPYHDPSDNGADPQTGWVTPSGGQMRYEIYNRLVQTDNTVGSQVSRVLLSYFVLATGSASASFNASGGLNGGDPSTVTGGASAGSGANSNAGFSSLGNFGGQTNGSVNGGGGNSASTGTAFGTVIGGTAGGTTGNAFSLPAAGGLPPPPAEDGVRPIDIAITTLPTTLEELLALGSRPAALADFGRSAAAGSAANVFNKRYPIARTLDDSVCGGGDLQPGASGTASTRACPR